MAATVKRKGTCEVKMVANWGGDPFRSTLEYEDSGGPLNESNECHLCSHPVSVPFEK